MSDFSTHPKSKYQRAYKRFHELCVLVGKPKGMISKKVYKVRQAHNRLNKIRPLHSVEYDLLSNDVQRALDSCMKNLDEAETKINKMISLKGGD